MAYVQPEKIAYVIQEAAEAAGISERQLRRAMAAGELRYSFKAGRRRIFPDDLRAYLRGDRLPPFGAKPSAIASERALFAIRDAISPA
jgi:hypothetical protein